MSKVTVETINGKLCTVVWHMTWQDGLLPRGRNWIPAPYGYAYVMDLPEMEKHVCAVALFALPRHPKPSDAKLLHRYAAEGIELMADNKYGDTIKALSDEIRRYNWEITHATDMETGERVEVAIEGDKVEGGGV